MTGTSILTLGTGPEMKSESRGKGGAMNPPGSGDREQNPSLTISINLNFLSRGSVICNLYGV